MKFVPHGTGKQNQNVTYTAVKEHIIQHVQKTYRHGQDVAISLRAMQKIDLSQHKPKRTMASPNEKEKEVLQEGYDILYKAQVGKYIDRISILAENLAKAYALIYSTYCNRTIQHRIEEHPDFESKIRDDPIELLAAIKILMHDPARAKYPYASLTEAIT